MFITMLKTEIVCISASNPKNMAAPVQSVKNEYQTFTTTFWFR